MNDILTWLDRLIGLVLSGPRKLGWLYQRALRRALRNNCYSFEDGSIVRTRGLRSSQKVVAAEIARWWVVYEMVFDIVCIELASGEYVQWLDYYNDLLGILRQVASEKQIEPPYPE